MKNLDEILPQYAKLEDAPLYEALVKRAADLKISEEEIFRQEWPVWYKLIDCQNRILLIQNPAILEFQMKNGYPCKRKQAIVVYDPAKDKKAKRRPPKQRTFGF